MAVQLFFLFSSYASIVGLIVSLDIGRLQAIHWSWIGITTAVFLGMLFSVWQSRTPRVYAPSGVNDYMLTWVGQEGKAAIFSNDLTWAREDGRIKDVLLNKARRNELILCLPKQIPLTEELQKAGAQVYTYEHLHVVPESRFTIVKFGRGDATVAIGRRTKDGKHQIEEIANGEHPSFAVANDLINVIKALSEHSTSGAS